MNNLRVIGHRGVRDIEVENTKNAFKKAVELGADAVELDIRSTSDGQLLVCHNRNLEHIYGVNKKIDQITFQESQKLKSKNGDNIPTLKDILDLNLGKPLILDIKSRGLASKINDLMEKSKQEWRVTTFLHDEALEFRKLNQNLWVSCATFARPIKAILTARKIRANAVTLPLYAINPVTYLLAKHLNVEIAVYQNYIPWMLTNKTIVSVIDAIYPGMLYCTDRPDKISSLFKKPS